MSIMISKTKSKRVPLRIKLQILEEMLLPDASIPTISKKYNLSSATLYGWRSHRNKTVSQNIIKNNDYILTETPKNNFIELSQEDVAPQEQDLSPLGKTPLSTSQRVSDPIAGATPNNSKSTNSKLSEISLIFNNNTSLLLKGTINSSSLIRIINCLEEEESC